MSLPITVADQHLHGGRVVAIWTFVTQRGWTGPDREDLVQMMLCEWWARGAQSFDYALAYLHALDHLDPRQGTRIARERRSTQLPRRVTVEPQYTVNFESAVYAEELLAQCGKHAWWLRKIAYEGWSLADVARVENVTMAALTRRLAKLRHAMPGT